MFAMKVTYVSAAGTEETIDLKGGVSVQEGAIQNCIEGIDADCGGGMSCATCMVFIPEEWQEKVGQPSDHEQGMLEAVEGSKANSRLSCQIKMTEELDGLVVLMPEEQPGC
jgi:ferredoxin, 2Fe-2S